MDSVQFDPEGESSVVRTTRNDAPDDGKVREIDGSLATLEGRVLFLSPYESTFNTRIIPLRSMVQATVSYPQFQVVGLMAVELSNGKTLSLQGSKENMEAFVKALTTAISAT